MTIKLKDMGAFFFKPKKATEVFNGMYIKGSYFAKIAKEKKVPKKKMESMKAFLAPDALFFNLF